MDVDLCGTRQSQHHVGMCHAVFRSIPTQKDCSCRAQCRSHYHRQGYIAAVLRRAYVPSCAFLILVFVVSRHLPLQATGVVTVRPPLAVPGQLWEANMCVWQVQDQLSTQLQSSIQQTGLADQLDSVSKNFTDLAGTVLAIKDDDEESDDAGEVAGGASGAWGVSDTDADAGAAGPSAGAAQHTANGSAQPAEAAQAESEAAAEAVRIAALCAVQQGRLSSHHPAYIVAPDPGSGHEKRCVV